MESDGIFRARNKDGSFEESKQQESFSETKPTYIVYTQQRTEEMMDKVMTMVLWVSVAVSQAIGVSCIVLVVCWCNLYGGFSWTKDPELQFFVHPLMMVLGLVLCYGDSIIVYRVLYFLPKNILKLVHAVLHLSAIVLSSIGLAAVFENHRRTRKPDMYSLHSWVGIATFALFCLQYIVSFATFLFPGLPLTLRARVMPFHTFFGLGIFILAVATVQMGLTERLIWTPMYNKGAQEGLIGNSLGILLIVFGFLIVFIATHSHFKRKPLPSEITPTN